MSTALKKVRDDADAEGGSGMRLKEQPAVTASRRSDRVTRIAAVTPWYRTGLGELVRAWELLLVFTWRQIGVQYKQAVLGIGWAVLSPLLSTLVFTFVFGNLAAIPSEGLP